MPVSVRSKTSQVVVALAELAAPRHRFAFDGRDQRVDERRRLAAVVEQAGRLVARHAFARIRLAAVVRVALHHVAPVLHVLDHHVGPGADRPGVQRQADLGHARLGIEGIGLPRHRRHEGHLHPVAPLRIFALDADAQQVLLGRRGTGQRPAAEVEEGLVEAGRVEAGAQLASSALISGPYSFRPTTYSAKMPDRSAS